MASRTHVLRWAIILTPLLMAGVLGTREGEAEQMPDWRWVHVLPGSDDFICAGIGCQPSPLTRCCYVG